MIYVVASHEGFVQWMADHDGKDAIHVNTMQRAEAIRVHPNDEIHFAAGGDREVYAEMSLR